MDGPDGSGKAELSSLIRSSFNNQVLINHSSLATYYVLEELIHRPAEDRRNYLSELSLMERAYDLRQVVCFKAPLKLLEDESRETIRLGVYQSAATVDTLITQTKLFGAWCSLTKRLVPTMQVWTDAHSPAYFSVVIHDWIIASLNPILDPKLPSSLQA